MRVLGDTFPQPGGGGLGEVFAVIELGLEEIAHGQRVLDVLQPRPHLVHQRRVGELAEEILHFNPGPQGVGGVAVRFLHHVHVDLDHVGLGVVGQIGGGEKELEVLERLLRLNEVLDAPLAQIGVGDVVFGLLQVRGFVVGVDQGLERQPRLDELALGEELQPVLMEGLVRQDRLLLEAGLLAATGGEQDQAG